MTTAQVLDFVLAHPGTTARQVAQSVYGEGRARTAARGKTDSSLRALYELGLVERRRAPPRFSNDSPYYVYNPGPMALQQRKEDHEQEEDQRGVPPGR